MGHDQSSRGRFCPGGVTPKEGEALSNRPAAPLGLTPLETADCGGGVAVAARLGVVDADSDSRLALNLCFGTGWGETDNENSRGGVAREVDVDLKLGFVGC